MSEHLRWIESSGSPLILLPRELIACWEGIALPGPGRAVEARFRWHGDFSKPASDYDRACDINDYLGLLSVGTGFGLVLNDQPLRTCWFAISDSAGLLVRWDYADDENSVQDSLTKTPGDIWQPTEFSLEVKSGELVLFDSSHQGMEAMEACEFLSILLQPGLYSVDSSEYRPDERTSLLLHRLRPC